MTNMHYNIELCWLLVEQNKQKKKLKCYCNSKIVGKKREKLFFFVGFFEIEPMHFLNI